MDLVTEVMSAPLGDMKEQLKKITFFLLMTLGKGATEWS